MDTNVAGSLATQHLQRSSENLYKHRNIEKP